jgi:hypothetical protein
VSAHLVLAVVGVAAGAAIAGSLRNRHHLPRHRVLHMRIRLHLRLRPGKGHGTLLQLWLRWGRLASYRESRRTRPSLARRERISHPQAHSFYLGRAQWGHTLRVTVQEHGCLIGPPRANKSALLSRVIMSAPGAVVSTSSKADLFMLTSGVRQQGGPVYVFNPMNIGGVPSNVRWSPLEGCADPATAIRRADAFSQAVSTQGAEDASFWAGKSSDYLRGFFAAGALIGGDMRMVGRWVAGEQPAEAIGILDQAGRTAWAGQLAELTGPAEKTTHTVRMVMSRAVAYLNDPQLAAATLPAPGASFDIDQFLLSGGTLYMIAKGNGEDCTLGPLFAALACEIEFRATQLGSQLPGGRLDPPLLMALDEVTQICPVPLPSWLADAGGMGVSVWTAFHGMAQLVGRWKVAGAQAVMDTTNVRVFMPGLADAEVLDQASKLAGQAAYREHGHEGWSRHPVLTPDMIRMLPAGWALAQRGPHAPVVFKVAKGWRDRSYRQARRKGTAVAAVIPPPAIEVASDLRSPAARPTPVLTGIGGPAELAKAELARSIPADRPADSYPWSEGGAA